MQRETAGARGGQAPNGAVFPQTMTGQRFGKCIVLCLLPWSYLSLAWSDATGPGTASPAAGHVRKGLPSDAANGTDVQSNISVPCTALPPPRYGYYYVDRGSGVSLGSVLVYWCQEGYRLVGSERLACLRQDSASSWSHPPPQCQAAPQPAGTGSRMAVAASLLSGAVILALSVSFAVCCWRDRARKSRGGKQQQQRRRARGWKRDPSIPERGRNAFGRLKHYHRRDYHLSAVSSSVFPGAFAGCNNLAFQSSPAQQAKVPLERWRSEAQEVLLPVLPAGPAPGSGLPGHLPRTALLPARLRGDLLPFRGDLLPLRGDLLPLRSDLLPLRGDLLPLRGDLLPLRGDLLPLRGHLLPLRCAGLEQHEGLSQFGKPL